MSDRRAFAPPRDLTIPEAGSTTARDVLSRAIRRLLSELRPLVRAHASLAPAADVETFDRLLAAVLRDHMGPLASVLRKPNVGALVRTLRRPLTSESATIFRELIGLISFELAALGELPFEVRLRAFPRRVLSMVAQASVDVPADVSSVVLTPGRMSVTRPGEVRNLDLEALRMGGAGVAGAGVGRPFHVIDGSSLLATEDNNPLALDEAHPDKSGNTIDLGGASVEAWTTSLRGAFELVAKYLPDLRAEMELYVSQVIPVGVDKEKHLSASYQEAIGTLYMTLHPHAMTMTEALIHEFQHNKVNALFEIDDVLENAFSPLYPSPVRPDLRPLHGVLLAVHAFLPVARLYEQMIADKHPFAEQASFHSRFADVVTLNREGASVVLNHGKPTHVGAGLIDEVCRLDAHYRCDK